MSEDFVTQRDLDRVLVSIETLSSQSQIVLVNQATMTEQLKDVREDVGRTNHLLRGNGKPGLVTEVRLLSKKVADSEEKTKGQKAFWYTLITGALSGLGMILLEIAKALF